LIQANRRGIPLGPIASFNRWKELGRHVKRGEKAIELSMPVTSKRTVTEQAEDGSGVETEIVFKRFVFRRNWFMLSQTDGAAYRIPAIPAWDRARALATLNVQEIPFVGRACMRCRCKPRKLAMQMSIELGVSLSRFVKTLPTKP
jgi:hypothetical protein